MTSYEDMPSSNEELFISQDETAQTDGKANSKPEKSLALEEEMVHLETVEEKIKVCLNHMSKALTAHSTFKFKDFWEGKKRCLELFKQLTNSRLRSQLWTEYSSLSEEAKRLKEIKDEQSNFAAEQISLAIDALEADLQNYPTLLLQMTTHSTLPMAASIQKRQEFYKTNQNELNLLSTFASRVNALRKELIKTEMRLGFKSKLFDRLSLVGDQIFPKRKELVKAVSDAFTNDVQAFCSSALKEDLRLGASLQAVREEIKILQNLAKELALNSQVFSETRLCLSACWDKLKEIEKEKKKLFDEKKAESQVAACEIKTAIGLYAADVLSGKDPALLKQAEEAIFSKMKEKELSREDFKELKLELYAAKKPLLEKLAKEEEERKNQAAALLRQKEEALNSFKEALISSLKMESVPELEAVYLKASKEFENLVFEETKRDTLERLLFAVLDKLSSLKQREIQGEEALLELLEERKIRKAGIRERLEAYRKAIGGSSLDFEKAMYFNEALDLEKKALEAVSSQIEQIENQIDELEESD